MTRVIRILVLLVIALTLVIAPAADAYAGAKDSQRGAVTIEKGPQFIPGMARPVLPAGDGGPIEGFPKWTGQYFNSSVFFFWLYFGMPYRT